MGASKRPVLVARAVPRNVYVQNMTSYSNDGEEYSVQCSIKLQVQLVSLRVAPSTKECLPECVWEVQMSITVESMDASLLASLARTGLVFILNSRIVRTTSFLSTVIGWSRFSSVFGPSVRGVLKK